MCLLVTAEAYCDAAPRPLAIQGINALSPISCIPLHTGCPVENVVPTAPFYSGRNMKLLPLALKLVEEDIRSPSHCVATAAHGQAPLASISMMTLLPILNVAFCCQKQRV